MLCTSSRRGVVYRHLPIEKRGGKQTVIHDIREQRSRMPAQPSNARARFDGPPGRGHVDRLGRQPPIARSKLLSQLLCAPAMLADSSTPRPPWSL
jgi:hypothetical protein